MSFQHKYVRCDDGRAGLDEWMQLSHELPIVLLGVVVAYFFFLSSLSSSQLSIENPSEEHNASKLHQSSAMSRAME